MHTSMRRLWTCLLLCVYICWTWAPDIFIYVYECINARRYFHWFVLNIRINAAQWSNGIKGNMFTYNWSISSDRSKSSLVFARNHWIDFGLNGGTHSTSVTYIQCHLEQGTTQHTHSHVLVPFISFSFLRCSGSYSHTHTHSLYQYIHIYIIKM